MLLHDNLKQRYNALYEEILVQGKVNKKLIVVLDWGGS